MRRLIIQIPCLNEAETLPQTLADLPRHVEGFDEVKWLVIDDGSNDETAEVARQNGVDYVLQLGRRMGLARAFSEGLEYCLGLGADVVVNTDADNQYAASCIPDLLRPILDGKALIVVGERPITEIASFSPLKKLLQRFGSWVVRKVSRTEIPDAVSGFRAFHADAAIQIKIFSNFSYTLETIIQAGLRSIPMTSVPIAVNPVTRPSRLVVTTWHFVFRSAITTIRMFIIYAPVRFFLILSMLTILPAMLLWVRFLVFYVIGYGTGHIQSLILSSVLAGIAGIFGLAALMGDLMAANRKMLEEVRIMLRRRELNEVRVCGKGASEPKRRIA